MKESDFEIEVFKVLKKEARNHKPAIPWYYNSSLSHIGNIPVPLQRLIYKGGYSFKSQPFDMQKRIWFNIWQKSPYFEVLSQATLFLEECNKKKVFTDNDWPYLKQWVKKVDNWAHSDSLSSIYADMHERFPKTVYPTLKSWNKSKNPWERRASIVSLFYYSRMRKNRIPPLKEVLPLLKNLILDPHVYVQKGVGWTIREIYNEYPKEALKLISENAHIISPQAWYATTEKLSKREKERVLALRKKR